MIRRALLVAMSSAALLGHPSDGAGAQAVRVSGSTSVRYVELRPFERDSVAASSTTGEGLLRQLPDGRVVRCVPGEAFCREVRPGAVASTIPVIQDLDVAAWGFGEGIHAAAQIRGRSEWGAGTSLWPRSEDRLELMAAYVEVERNRLRARGGRQWRASSLGFFNFDGLSLAFAPVPRLRVEGYGGRSLTRGTNETFTGGALEAIEALAPPSDGILAGVDVRYRVASHASIAAAYQIDVRSDRRGLFSELLALEGMARLGAASIDGAVRADVATGQLNEARLRYRSPPVGRFLLFGELRRHRPFFELWTIWGAFSPVGFDEVRAGGTWAARGDRLILRLDGTYRSYDDEGAAESPDSFRRDGRGMAAGIAWNPTREWRVDAAGRVEAGFGAARRDASVGVSRRFGEVASVSVSGLAFERLYEFRLDEGTVVGVGADGWVRLGDRVRLFAGAAVYRHGGAQQAALDWNQRRASIRLQWTMGGEPEMSRAAEQGTP